MFTTILSCVWSLMLIWTSLNAIITIVQVTRLFLLIGKHGWINAGTILLKQRSVILKSWGSILLVAGYGNKAFKAMIAGSLIAMVIAAVWFLIMAIKGTVNLFILTAYLVFCLLAGIWLQKWTKAGVACLKAHRS